MRKSPYNALYGNRKSNFVAACHVCNGIKTSLIFKDIDDARIHITERWKDKGYADNLPPMSIEFQPETAMAKILHTELPSDSVVQ